MNDTVRFIPIGGVGDVTKNMYAYEYQDEILIVDCGIGFPKEEMYGVDLLIPDTTYLLDKKDKIVGMLLTHGHEDHIGGLPYILPTLPKFPIYATKLTTGLANAKLVECNMGTPVKAINYREKIKLSKHFSATFYHVTHSIPDSSHIAIETPVGTFFHAADFKIDLTPVDEQPSDLLGIAEVGKKGVVALFSDCLRSEESGLTPSERTIQESIDKEMQKCTGKFIMTTYSSNISRHQQAINVAKKYNRKVCFIGRSMVQAKDVAKKLGFLHIPEGMEIEAEQIKNHDGKQLLLIVAGSQGQENSAMSRVANDVDKFIKISEKDTVVFAADPIPGNENAVNSLIDALSKHGTTVIYSDINDGFHVSGHGSASDLMLMMQLTNPKFLLPIGGTYRHMVQYRKLALDMGFNYKDVLLVDGGQAVGFSTDSYKLLEKLHLRNVYVDDLEGKEVQHAIIRDRQKLAEDGMVVVIVQYDLKEGKLYGDVDILSRGFVDLMQNKELLSSLHKEVRTILSEKTGKPKEWHFIRKLIENSLEKFIFKKTRRRPLILPLVVEV